MEKPEISGGEPSAEEVSKNIMDFALAGSRDNDENPKDLEPKSDKPSEEEPKSDLLEGKVDPIKEETEPIQIKRTSKFPEITDNDFSENEDGTIVIKAKHVADDLKTIVEKDASLFLQIHKANGGEKKAEVIAKALGFKSDGVRSVSSVAKDVIEAFVGADTEEEKAEISEKFFPDQLRYTDSEKLYSEEIQEKDKPVEYSESEKTNAINAYLVERRDLTREDLTESVKFNDEMKKNKFSQETGEPLSAEEAVKIAAEKSLGELKITPRENLVPDGGGKGGKEPIITEEKTEAEKVSASIVEKMRARLIS